MTPGLESAAGLVIGLLRLVGVVFLSLRAGDKPMRARDGA